MATTEKERRDYLYRYVGEALHLAQGLELQIRTLIGIVNNHFHAEIDVEGLIVPERRETLGQLMRQLRSLGKIDENGKQILEDALEKRNYIAHYFFNKNAYAFSVDEVFKNTKITLDADTKAIAAGVAITLGWLEALCESLKIEKSNILVKQSDPESVTGDVD